MKIRYYVETDTLYIEFRPGGVVETRDLDENTLLDLDDDGKICALTIEHVLTRAPSPVVGSGDRFRERLDRSLPELRGRIARGR